MIELMNAFKTLLIIGVVLYAAIIYADTPSSEIAILDNIVGCSPERECETEGATCEGYNPREVFMHGKVAVVYEEQWGVCMKDGEAVGERDGK